jgi:hypothetical protein
MSPQPARAVLPERPRFLPGRLCSDDCPRRLARPQCRSPAAAAIGALDEHATHCSRPASGRVDLEAASRGGALRRFTGRRPMGWRNARGLEASERRLGGDRYAVRARRDGRASRCRRTADRICVVSWGRRPRPARRRVRSRAMCSCTCASALPKSRPSACRRSSRAVRLAPPCRRRRLGRFRSR